MRQLAVKEFLERTRDMPDIEAEQEIVMRRESHAMEHVVITNARIALEESGDKGAEWRRLGQEIAVMCQDSILLAEALKACRKRQDAIEWPKAVRAIFGEEGVLQCRIWMATQGLTNPAAYNRPMNLPKQPA